MLTHKEQHHGERAVHFTGWKERLTGTTLIKSSILSKQLRCFVPTSLSLRAP